MEEIIKPVLPAEWLSADTKYFINPTGQFIIGSPQGDCGLTGRKIIVDTYGGMARHGVAFSGKDPSKVDRSAAIWAAMCEKYVAAGLADKWDSFQCDWCRTHSILAETFGTEHVATDTIVALVKKHFDLRPHAITEQLNLLRPFTVVLRLMATSAVKKWRIGKKPTKQNNSKPMLHITKGNKHERRTSYSTTSWL